MAKHRAPRPARVLARRASRAPLPAYWLRDTTGEFHAADPARFGAALCGNDLRSWESRQTPHSKKCPTCLARVASPAGAPAR